MSNNASSHKDLLVTALGAGSTVIVAGVMGFIEVKYGLALYSFMFFFIIPAGAGFAGFAAASGYYLGAKMTHQRPAGGALLNMIGASISAYLLVHYIPYYLLEVDGIRVQEFLSFWKYLDITITNTSLQFSMRGSDIGSPAELGTGWGYAYATLQVVGFAAGGLLVFIFLSESPYCDACSKYMTETGKQVRHTNDGEKLISDIQDFADFLVDENYKEGIRHHSTEMGSTTFDHKLHHLASQIIIHECPSCGINRLNFVTSKLKGNDWSDIEETRIVQATNEKLTVA